MLLLDTNVISELRKVRQGNAHPSVARWSQSLSTADLYLSAVTIEELERGVLLMERRDASQGQRLRDWLDNQVLPAFADRILPVDATVARCSAALQVPDPIPYRDSLIAATALVHRMVLVTSNTADFNRTGLTLKNPWLV